MNSGIKRYGTFTEDAATESSELARALAGNVFINAETGQNVFRFLPPLEGKTSIYRITAIHYIDPLPGMDKKLVFACPRIESKGGSTCPACMASAEIGRRPDRLSQEQAKRLLPSFRVMANVIARRSPEPVVRIFAFGKGILEDLNTIRKSPRLGGDFTDPTDAGFDIIIDRAGTGMSTKYTVSADRHSSPLHADPSFADQLISMQYDLDRYVDPTVPEELAQVLQAIGLASQPVAYQGRVGFAGPGVSGGPVTNAPAVPARQLGAGVGAGLMSELRRKPVAAPTAMDYTDTEFDDDFNPIDPLG